MRRKDREITDRAAIEAILRRAAVCRIGLVGEDGPYIVPMSLGYEAGRLYLHSAREGRKLDLIREDPRVCFEVDLDSEVVKAESPCGWSLRYRSVIGFGRAVLVEAPEEKRRGLEIILRHHGGDPSALPERSLDGVSLIRIEIREMTGKQSGY
jgi:nitroimidazol reductase NimA-like FMN-containing flavoprotein (pyridoxamine 5'-phosphate oxidase superfamily)